MKINSGLWNILIVQLCELYGLDAGNHEEYDLWTRELREAVSLLCDRMKETGSWDDRVLQMLEYLVDSIAAQLGDE
jgi:hypothetical protein